MNRTRSLGLAVIVLLLAAPGAHAQYDPPVPGDVFVFSSQSNIPPVLGSTSLIQYYPCLFPVPGAPFDIDIYAWFPEAGVTALDLEVTFPPGLFFIGSTLLTEGELIPDITTEEDDVSRVRIEFGTCRQDAEAIPLLRYSILSLTSLYDAPVCLTGPATGDQPQWIDCTDAPVAANAWPPGYQTYPAGCGILNPTEYCPVDGRIEAWSAVKARF